ncbi:Oligosaccharyltransferase complex subunit ostc [Intoshia linei]|uniref:Oligosaccharyltransferase complex subunit n=1 Tax=Intoshia linei TaxID=1819745 RepID=A0A177B6R2_9BILA|nr:Oligosaccharyltransferase complex subunit ostc [Intoshia linei]
MTKPTTPKIEIKNDDSIMTIINVIKAPFTNRYTYFVLFFVLYFFITSGFVHMMIIQPPLMGTERDKNGNTIPVIFLPHAQNRQYILEGFIVGMVYTIGALGLILLENFSDEDKMKSTPFHIVVFLVIMPFMLIKIFSSIKM